jgi:hypothetical protein
LKWSVAFSPFVEIVSFAHVSSSPFFFKQTKGTMYILHTLIIVFTKKIYSAQYIFLVPEIKRSQQTSNLFTRQQLPSRFAICFVSRSPFFCRLGAGKLAAKPIFSGPEIRPTVMTSVSVSNLSHQGSCTPSQRRNSRPGVTSFGGSEAFDDGNFLMQCFKLLIIPLSIIFKRTDFFILVPK